MQERKLVHVLGDAVRQRHNDRENHGCGAHNSRADQHRFRGGFKRVSGAVVCFQQILCALEVHVHVVVFFQLLLDVRYGFNLRKLVDRLRVVCNRTIRIYGDRDRTHTEETKGNQAKSENRSREHLRTEPLQADQITDRHQRDHRKPEVVAREVSGHEARQNAQRRAAFLRRGDHLSNVPRFSGRENLYQLRNHSSS